MKISALTPGEKSAYVEFVRLVDAWSWLGERLYPDGTRWIDHIPHRAPEAYLHHIFSRLDEPSIEELQEQLSYDLPNSFRRFLRLHNGVSVFTMFINIYRLRRSWTRTDHVMAAKRPFSILTPNVDERPAQVPRDMLFIGSLGDKRRLVEMLADGEVVQWNVESSQIPPKRYEDGFEFLLTETKSATDLFGDMGWRKDGSDLLGKPS